MSHAGLPLHSHLLSNRSNKQTGDAVPTFFFDVLLVASTFNEHIYLVAKSGNKLFSCMYLLLIDVEGSYQNYDTFILRDRIPHLPYGNVMLVISYLCRTLYYILGKGESVVANPVKGRIE